MFLQQWDLSALLLAVLKMLLDCFYARRDVIYYSTACVYKVGARSVKVVKIYQAVRMHCGKSRVFEACCLLGTKSQLSETGNLSQFYLFMHWDGSVHWLVTLLELLLDFPGDLVVGLVAQTMKGCSSSSINLQKSRKSEFLNHFPAQTATTHRGRIRNVGGTQLFLTLVPSVLNKYIKLSN